MICLGGLTYRGTSWLNQVKFRHICSYELYQSEEICFLTSVLFNMTLSRLPSFIDGLWSCCGDGRIIIFTTNHREQLDPALSRPGRLDMHICFYYCTISGFKQLACNYLELRHHLFEQIERLIEKVEVTPAEVAKELMKINDPEGSLEGLFELSSRQDN